MVSALTSPQTRAALRFIHGVPRRVRREAPTVDVYLRVDDPYSLLLAQVLPELEERFSVHVAIRTVCHRDPSMFPAPASLARWAERDSADVADLYDLTGPSQSVQRGDAEQAALRLADQESSPDATRTVADAFVAWWSGHTLPPAQRPDEARERLAENERRLRRQGHYLGAMLRYAGEWYWGIDRLDHLERRLLADGHGRQEDCGPRFVRRHRLCAQPPTPARGPLVLYWSARSPYSYLVLDRAYALADHYGLGLDIRPVLPMVMRGMSVPRQKRLYILQDAKREAELLGLPLGRVCDPVGRGVRNLYAVFRAGQAEGRERELARSFSHAVWSEGIDAATERGLARITERAGLRPQRLRREPEAEWHEWAERHRQEMADAGMWGVPTLRYGSHWVWGQDRLWSLETAIRNHG